MHEITHSGCSPSCGLHFTQRQRFIYKENELHNKDPLLGDTTGDHLRDTWIMNEKD